MPLQQLQTASPYVSTTHGITVSVEPSYLAEQSDPEAQHFVWAYHVRIENHSSGPVRLLTRYWKITDARGTVREVHGDGVVGEQPTLAPGESFEYTSGTPLPTPSGIMVGTYGMTTESGQPIEVAIPAFSLDSPHERRQVH
ncbi:MAG: Co2+/Mg2+ efflux protein ApaG [Magnetospirillum sp. WYHS-4]